MNITVMGKQYIVPQGKIAELVAWLNANAVTPTTQPNQVNEIAQNSKNNTGGNQLIMENH